MVELLLIDVDDILDLFKSIGDVLPRVAAIAPVEYDDVDVVVAAPTSVLIVLLLFGRTTGDALNIELARGDTDWLLVFPGE